MGCAAAALLTLGFILSEVVNPLLIGLLCAYVLNPAVEVLERRGVRRDAAVTGLFSLVLGAAALVLGTVALKAADSFDDLRRIVAGERLLDPNHPADVRRIVEAGDRVRPAGDLRFVDEDGDGARRVGLAEKATEALVDQLGGRVSRADVIQLARTYQSQAGQVLGAAAELGEGFRASLGKLGLFFGYVLLVPIYTFFLLQYFSGLRDGVRDHLPGAYRARIVDIARKIDRQVAAFFRGKLILALLKGVVTWLGLWIAGVPFAALIGLGAGLLSVLPLIGPLLGGSLALLLCWDAPEGFATRAAWVLGAFAVAEAVEAVAQPVILGREVGLSPLVLILSLFVFGKLLGLFGVLLAVPIACAAKILIVELVLPEVEALAQEPGPDEAAGPPAGPPAVPTFPTRAG